MWLINNGVISWRINNVAAYQLAWLISQLMAWLAAGG
jgi:hypothetical protein